MSTLSPDINLSHVPPVATAAGPVPANAASPGGESTVQTPKDSTGGNRNRAETDPGREKREAQEKAEAKSKEQIPKIEDMEAGRFGCLPTKDRPARKAIDIGGNITIEQALAKKPEFRQRIDWDQALYDRISDPLKTLRQMNEDGSLDLSKLTRLQRKMLVKLDIYEKRFREIERRKAVTDRKDKRKLDNKLEGTERIFHSGEEVIEALGFVQETEILVAHALGYEITNGGQKTLSYGLTDQQVDILEQAPLPGQLQQAMHDLNLTQRNIAAALFSAGAIGGSAKVGAMIGALTGNAALAGAIAGSGAGIVLLGGSVAIGSWVLSFDKPQAGESIRFNIKFTGNVPGDTSQRITDNPLAKRFSGLGQPYHQNAIDYLEYAEKTRHGIYSRLGLRVEKHDITTHWNFKKLTLEQRAFIRSIGYNPDLAGNLPNAIQTTIQTMADQGIDLWMTDLNPANLSIPGGSLNFDRKVRDNIQILLARKHSNLPVTQISSDVSYRDLSGLSMAERHEIILEAIDLAGVAVCKDEADSVLQEIAIGGDVEKGIRAAEVNEITTRASQIESGTIVLHESGITPEKISEERRRLATAEDKVTAIKTQGDKIKEIDTQISQQEDALTSTQQEYQAALDEQGKRNSAGGLISQYEDAQKKVITEAIGKLQDLNTDTLGVPISAGVHDIVTINDLFHQIKTEILKLNGLLEIENPNDAIQRKGAVLVAARGNTPDLAGWDKRISEGKKLNDNIATLKQALDRVNECKTKLAEQESKIIEAEKIVRQKDSGRISADQKLKSSKDKRQKAIEEIWKWVDPTNTQQPYPPYGQKLYNTLFAEAQTAVEELQKELKKQGIPLEGEAVQISEEGKPIVVSKEDKEVVKGMNKIAAVCKADTFSAKVQGIRQRKQDELQEFADSRTSHDAVLRHVFGAEAVSPHERAFYQRLLSKAGLVEAYFESEGLTDARAATFFARQPEMFTAFRQSRENIEQIGRLVREIKERRQLYVAGETTVVNQTKILERQLKDLQSQNVRLLTPVYDKKIAPFLGENSITTSEYFRVVMDRMRRNALEYNPFADAVQVAEMLPVHTGPDGVTALRPPDINPTDNSWINRGGSRWASPAAGYQVNGEDINLSVDTSISAAGELGANMEVRVQTLGGALNILPDDKNVITGTPVAQELNRLGILPYLYDAGNAKRGDVNAVVDDMLNGPAPILPATKPNMAGVGLDVVLMNSYLQRFGLDLVVLDRLYGAGTAVGTAINPGEAKNITLEAVNKQVKQVILRIQHPGVANVNALEAWLSIADGSSYNFGGAEVQRISRSLARAISENPANVNTHLLGGAANNRFNRVTNGNFRVENENGELRLYHNVGGVIQSATLQEIFQLSTAARTARFAGFNDPILNDIILNVGKNAMEAIRQRTT